MAVIILQVNEIVFKYGDKIKTSNINIASFFYAINIYHFNAFLDP